MTDKDLSDLIHNEGIEGVRKPMKDNQPQDRRITEEKKLPLLKNDILRTPQYIIDALGPFDLDPCAGENTNIGTVNLWDGRDEDGLTTKWEGFVWCNPPFSQKELWAIKMINHKNGIMVLPERGSAPWFGPLAEQAGKYFVMGKKIDFEGGSSSNNLGSILFPFGQEAVSRIEKSGLPGHFVSVNWFRSRIFLKQLNS